MSDEAKPVPTLPPLTPPTPEGRPIHASYSETVERHYERCREQGLSREASNRLANEAAERNHRTWDRNRRER